MEVKKENLIELTQNLYRLTLLFPKKEPLRYKIRELANNILANFITNRGLSSVKFTEDFPLSILEELEVLDSFFEVAKNQNWVSPQEILKIQEEYSKLKGVLEKTKKEAIARPMSGVKPHQSEAGAIFRYQKIMDSNPSTTRRGKILEYLKENGRAQVWQIKKIFPEVTKRTLRRDFEFLLKQGKIERIGERNETFYQVRG